MTEKLEDDASSAMEAVSQTPKSSAPRAPLPETPEAIQTRFRVIAAFWAVIIFLGFPMWWKTTSIYRAHLPIEEMVEWADGKTCRPVLPLDIHITAPSMHLAESQHLVRTTQHALDDLNEFAAHHLRLKLTNSTNTSSVHNSEDESSVAHIGEVDEADTALTVQVLSEEGLLAPRSELHADTTQLDVFYPVSQTPIPSSLNPPLSVFIAEELQRLYAEEKATIAHILSDGSSTSDSASAGLTESISRRLRRSMKYADTYHLSFSLFTPGAEPSSWDIEAAVQDFLSPLLHAFTRISNFTIDTQVQLYAAFSPMAPPPVYDEAESAWTLKKEDLSAFINAAEWPLNPSIGSGPTLNFILYVPSPSQSPLVVKENRASSWIIPQWGGVFLLNLPLTQGSNPRHLTQESLRPAFMTFSHQLLTLLGTPSTPASLPLRLQSLVRIHAATLLLSASSTMGSLARLTESLPSIPIPAMVASSVSTTLSHLSAACSHLREGRFDAALASARVAETEAEKSFFEKSMVGQAYFPDEHKVAVYLPLLGPIGVPLVVGLVKELKRLVKSRKSPTV